MFLQRQGTAFTGELIPGIGITDCCPILVVGKELSDHPRNRRRRPALPMVRKAFPQEHWRARIQSVVCDKACSPGKEPVLLQQGKVLVEDGAAMVHERKTHAVATQLLPYTGQCILGLAGFRFAHIGKLREVEHVARHTHVHWTHLKGDDAHVLPQHLDQAAEAHGRVTYKNTKLRDKFVHLEWSALEARFKDLSLFEPRDLKPLAFVLCKELALSEDRGWDARVHCSLNGIDQSCDFLEPVVDHV